MLLSYRKKVMRTDKQCEASRANGAKSNGPKTPEGKANSAQNSNRHNLTGAQIILLSTEDPIEYLDHEEDYLKRFQPIDGVERDLVRKLIAASWREKRMDAMEAQMLEMEMDKQRPKVSREFEFISGETRQTLALLGTQDIREAWSLLSRYQAAARRSYNSAFKALRELQGDRFNRQPAAAPPINPATEIPEAAGEPAAETRNSQTNPRPAAAVSSLQPSALFRRREPENVEIPNEPGIAIPAGRANPLAA
jgi:hypothetical protein